MRKRLSTKPIGSRAFTLRDLVLLVAVLALAILMLSSMFAKPRNRVHAMNCCNNLKQVGLGFRAWAVNNGEQYPMSISTNSLGAREHIESGGVFRVFELMSNELSTPLMLTCPSDTRKPAKSFAHDFGDSNISYFVGMVSNSSCIEMLLSGDRNIQGGTKLPHGFLEFATNSPASWGPGMHNGHGNIGLGDGSVQGYDDAGLRSRLFISGGTNRLAIP